MAPKVVQLIQNMP